MKKDPAVKLKLSSSYAGIANYWKFFDGETKQLLKYDVYGKKKTAEENFQNWAKGKPEYQNIFSDWKAAYEDWKPYAKSRVYFNEGIMGSPLIGFASSLIQVQRALKAGSSAEEIKKITADLDKRRSGFLGDEDKPSDEKILAASTKMFYENVEKDQLPTGFYVDLQNKYGNLNTDEPYKKYAADVFNNTMIFDDAKWKAFVANPSLAVLDADPAFKHAESFINNYTTNISPKFQKFTAANNDYGRLYLKGVMAMNPSKAAMMYPDATFTMRVSYGAVKAYTPRDAVSYDFATTSKGILEKYKKGDYEFDLPAKQIELLKAKDFGQYADPVRKDLVVGFITSNDITGGNSGSPVINGRGELLGLAFDGNYEALSHKLAFDKDLNRTINVDIRYVLWCIDKLGGAKNIINELKLVR